MVPDKGVGAEAFAVIREAMAKQNKIALGSGWCCAGRERQHRAGGPGQGAGRLYPAGRTTRCATPSEYFDDIPTVKADKDMVDIAARIIGQKDADFDPSQFKDRYDEALKAMIKAKQKGAGRGRPRPSQTTPMSST